MTPSIEPSAYAPEPVPTSRTSGACVYPWPGLVITMPVIAPPATMAVAAAFVPLPSRDTNCTVTEPVYPAPPASTLTLVTRPSLSTGVAVAPEPAVTETPGADAYHSPVAAGSTVTSPIDPGVNTRPFAAETLKLPVGTLTVAVGRSTMLPSLATTPMFLPVPAAAMPPCTSMSPRPVLIETPPADALTPKAAACISRTRRPPAVA